MPAPDLPEKEDTREPVLSAEEFVGVVAGESAAPPPLAPFPGIKIDLAGGATQDTATYMGLCRTCRKPFEAQLGWTCEHVTDGIHRAVRVAPEPEPAPPISPEALVARAIDKGLDVATMERLLAMRTQLKAEAAREAYFAALSAFQAEVPVVPKSKTAKVQSRSGGSYVYHYADLADIGKAIGPALAAQGLSYRFNTAFEKDPPAQLVQCIIQHVGGHAEASDFRSPIDSEARMLEVQKNGSALTYGKRYALCNALGILTADEDDDGQATAPQIHADEKWKTPKANGEAKPSAPVPVAVGQDIIEGMRADWSAKFEAATTKQELAMAGAEFGKASQNPNHPLHKDKALTALYSEKRAGLK